MSGLGVDVDVYGAGTAAGALRRIGAHAVDPRPAMIAIRELLAEGNRQQFASRGSFLSTPWPSNSPGTLARKARMGQGSSPMQASGALGAAIGGGAGKRTRVSRTSVSVGVAPSLFYAVFHFKDIVRSRGGAEPARPPIGISLAERQTALTILEHYLMTGHL
jgi:hypothetical protein